MKTIIVTAADEHFADMAHGLLRSLHQWGDPPCDEIGLLDLGLSEQSRDRLSRYVSTIVEPGWDFEVDPLVRETRPHVRALLARPKLRSYFPGRDLYLWLDADMWVQERVAIDWYFTAARNGRIGLVPSGDRSYVYHPTHIQWRWQNLRKYFGDDALRLYHFNQYYNAGAFSLRHDAPHWDSWANWFERALAVDDSLICDQAVLNYAIWKDGLAVSPLPSLCNWLCQYRIPGFDVATGRYHEPHIPHAPIGILHLAGKSKYATVEARHNGNLLEFNLRYGGLKAALDSA